MTKMTEFHEPDIEKIGTGISVIHQAVAEHGGTELELHYNDFFTTTFRSKIQVA